MDGAEWSTRRWKNGFLVADGTSIVGLTIPGSTQMFRKSKQLYLMSLFTYYDTKNDTEPIIYFTRMSNFLIVSELIELALIRKHQKSFNVSYL